MFIKFILYNITVMFKDLSVYTGCFFDRKAWSISFTTNINNPHSHCIPSKGLNTGSLIIYQWIYACDCLFIAVTNIFLFAVSQIFK